MSEEDFAGKIFPCLFALHQRTNRYIMKQGRIWQMVRQCSTGDRSLKLEQLSEKCDRCLGTCSVSFNPKVLKARVVPAHLNYS
jgi:hypothetical protein